jgi:hypothetical protein
MNWIEILLIIIGIVAFIGSFIIKGKAEKTNQPIEVDPEIIKDMVNKEMEDARERVNEVVDETLQYAVEKTERASERISNEKIMAISEYSDTVLADINKSHQEVMFLYDMLNDKHDNIKETVKQVDKTTKEAKEISLEISKEISKEAGVKETSKDSAVEVVKELPKEAPKAIAQKEEKFAAFDFIDQLPHVNRDGVPVSVEAHAPVSVALQQTEHSELPVQSMSQSAVAPEIIEELLPAAVDNKDNSEVTEPEQQDAQQQVVEQQVVEQPENNNDRILEMHKAGIDNVDIARELGLGVGEVKLVINLFKGAI